MLAYRKRALGSPLSGWSLSLASAKSSPPLESTLAWSSASCEPDALGSSMLADSSVTGELVGAYVGNDVGNDVGAYDGSGVGPAVGSYVGNAVGPGVGAYDGYALGAGDGAYDGIGVGSAVGLVGTGVGAPGNGACARPFGWSSIGSVV